ncbi:ATP-binding protein [Deinococcus aerophilus]|uniref:IstB-like ATP-binding domain-containing protein n=1 Tax=Deinococcus aerophilus TaxID=522488 RepID=A0ABQ2GX22_9DEIO|nr:ATP-binding protein [Deinococcus aerophilus]GGM16330.1 hypothetical protein GCM10010841_25830 [Deinococcus aerophilus]
MRLRAPHRNRPVRLSDRRRGDPAELDRAVLRGAQTEANRRAFLASLPPRYGRYATTPVPAQVLAANPELRAKLERMTPQGFLYLTGEADAAKTHLAVRQALHLTEGGGSALFVDETDYFARVFAEFGGGPPAPDLLAPDVLVYDDLGKQKPSEFALQKLYHLLEMRWSHEKALIVTSNFTPREVVARLTDDEVVGHAIYSRLMAGQLAGIRRGAGGRQGSAL